MTVSRRPRPQIPRIGVGADHDAVGGHARAALRLDRPSGRCSRDRAPSPRSAPWIAAPAADRRPGKAARIGQRLDRAAAPVDPGGKILRRCRGAGRFRSCRTTRPAHRGAPIARRARAPPRPLAARMRALDPAVAHVRHVHPMLGDEVEHGIGGAAGECDQLRAALAAEHRFQVVRIVFQPRDHLPAIAPGPAVARLLRLQHDRRSRRAPRDAARSTGPHSRPPMTQTSACVDSSSGGVERVPGGAVAAHSDGSSGNGSAITLRSDAARGAGNPACADCADWSAPRAPGPPRR